MTVVEAYKKMALLCSRREYCISDIQQKMSRWEMSQKDKTEVVSQLLADNFIDESRFAEAFVKDKFRFNKWGKNKIIYSLKQKRIADKIIFDALEWISDKDYRILIKELLEAKYKTQKSENNYIAKSKLLRFMTQRGFEYDLVNEAIDALFNKS